MSKFYFIIFIIFLSTPCFAYIGPGMGGGVLASVLGIFIAIFLGFFGILYYPLKRAYKKRKEKKLLSKKSNNELS